MVPVSSREARHHSFPPSSREAAASPLPSVFLQPLRLPLAAARLPPSVDRESDSVLMSSSFVGMGRRHCCFSRQPRFLSPLLLSKVAVVSCPSPSHGGSAATTTFLSSRAPSPIRCQAKRQWPHVLHPHRDGARSLLLLLGSRASSPICC